jgi:hypothetical protein
MCDVRSPDEHETYEWASTTYQLTKEQQVSKNIMDDYVSVISDIAQDIGYIEGVQEEMLEFLLNRMGEHINVFNENKVVFSDATKANLIQMGLEDNLDRVSA